MKTRLHPLLAAYVLLLAAEPDLTKAWLSLGDASCAQVHHVGLMFKADRIRERQGDTPAAIAACEEALRLDTNKKEAREQLSRLRR